MEGEVLTGQWERADHRDQFPQGGLGEQKANVGEERWDRGKFLSYTQVLQRFEGDKEASTEMPFSIVSWCLLKCHEEDNFPV